eukprot:scaffold57115_cov66-Phaeocystis_antarctica.AAC.1
MPFRGRLPLHRASLGASEMGTHFLDSTTRRDNALGSSAASSSSASPLRAHSRRSPIRCARYGRTLAPCRSSLHAAFHQP